MNSRSEGSLNFRKCGREPVCINIRGSKKNPLPLPIEKDTLFPRKTPNLRKKENDDGKKINQDGIRHLIFEASERTCSSSLTIVPEGNFLFNYNQNNTSSAANASCEQNEKKTRFEFHKLELRAWHRAGAAPHKYRRNYSQKLITGKQSSSDLNWPYLSHTHSTLHYRRRKNIRFSSTKNDAASASRTIRMELEAAQEQRPELNENGMT